MSIMIKPIGVTFAWLSMRKGTASEFCPVTMSITCHALISGSKRFTGIYSCHLPLSLSVFLSLGFPYFWFSFIHIIILFLLLIPASPLSVSRLCLAEYVHFVEGMFVRVLPSLLYLTRKSLLFDSTVHIKKLYIRVPFAYRMYTHSSYMLNFQNFLLFLTALRF